MGAAGGRPGRGASCLDVGRPVSGALPPRTACLLGGCRGPLPTGCGCGGMRAWGTVTNPTARALASWLCALWGRHEGARGGRLLPGCRASGVGRSPDSDCPGGLPGATTHWLWVRGGAGVGTRHQPHSARSCELALRAVGGMTVPGGAPPAWVWGVRGRALSNPRLPALWAGCRGPLPTGCGCGGVRAWGPVANPTARSFELALRAVGAARGRLGGGASCLGVGHPGAGALPPPTVRHLGGLPGPATHWLWVRGGAGVGTRHQPHSARSCELALRALGAA